MKSTDIKRHITHLDKRSFLCIIKVELNIVNLRDSLQEKVLTLSFFCCSETNVAKLTV